MPLENIPNLDLFHDESIARFTAARLGGNADSLVIVRTQDALLRAVLWAHENNTPWLILGGGANVLISDAGFRGLVIINRARESTIDAATGSVEADSGVSLINLARRSMNQGLKGLGWGVSVPGTVGGAVINNAGAHGGDMSKHVQSVRLLDLQHSTTPQTWSLDDLQYEYRHSALKGKPQRYVVLSAVLGLEPGHDAVELNREADEFVAYRKKTQPPGASTGSMFKNPPNDYAGRLIEAAGLKGLRMGGVQVSPVHANFFVNDEAATTQDYYQLVRHVQQVVMEQFGVELELEVEMLGHGFD